jgi:hypothetical protein
MKKPQSYLTAIGLCIIFLVVLQNLISERVRYTLLILLLSLAFSIIIKYRVSIKDKFLGKSKTTKYSFYIFLALCSLFFLFITVKYFMNQNVAKKMYQIEAIRNK